MKHLTRLIVAFVTIPFLLYFLYRQRSPASTTPLTVPRHDKHIVVASTTQANTQWVERELPDWTPMIYVADDPSAPLHPPVNKGREANIYLTYILEHYAALPRFMVFTHEHRWSWHVDTAFTSNPESINSLNLAHVARVGYQSLHCTRAENKGKLAKNRAHVVAAAWQYMFLEPMPDFIDGPLFAQFAVTREQVLRRPKADYERMYKWLMETTERDIEAGGVFEHTWHFIFSMPALLETPRAECLCNAYNLCDASSEDVQRAISGSRAYQLDGMPLGYSKWEKSQQSKGLEADLMKYIDEQMLQKYGPME